MNYEKNMGQRNNGLFTICYQSRTQIFLFKLTTHIVTCGPFSLFPAAYYHSSIWCASMGQPLCTMAILIRPMYHDSICYVVIFEPLQKQGSDVPFTGLTSADSLTAWARALCVPRVRVLTFENAEVGHCSCCGTTLHCLLQLSYCWMVVVAVLFYQLGM